MVFISLFNVSFTYSIWFSVASSLRVAVIKISYDVCVGKNSNHFSVFILFDLSHLTYDTFSLKIDSSLNICVATSFELFHMLLPTS